jgi:hypothetical protein
MYSKIIKNNHSRSSLFVHSLSVTLLAVILLFFYNDAHGNEKIIASLQLEPEQCVAMQKGQHCYVTVDVFWQTSQVGDYCLFLANNSEPLNCWQGKKQAKFLYHFSHNDSRIFQLKSRSGDVILVEAVLEIAWVYKTKRVSSSWRMF